MKINENLIPLRNIEIDSRDFAQFRKYLNNFYGKKGVYPNKYGKDLDARDILKAIDTIAGKKPKHEWEWDSLDRELVRDELIKMKKFDYPTQEAAIKEISEVGKYYEEIEIDKDEMEKLHKDGEVEVDGEKISFEEGKKVKTDKYGNHLEPQFKKGDKVTYLGNKGVITKVNKESGGVYSYDVSYDKGSGKTKASNIFNKGGELKNESVTEGKKRFDTMYGVGKAKYVVNYHDGKKKHKDGSDFFDIEIFKNQKDFNKFQKDLLSKGYIEEGVNEGKKRFYQQDNIGSSKYTINYHDGKSKNRDGSDFYGIKIFKNKKDLETFRKDLLSKGYREDSGSKNESVNEAFKPSQVRSTISKVKKGLMKKWAQKGGYENFGDKEGRVLRDKFNFNPYGSSEEREIAKMIQGFEDWAMNYDGSMREGLNEADVVGKTIFSDGKGKLFFGYYKTDDAVEFVDYKTWKKLGFKDVSKGDTNKERVIKAILKNQKQFNKKVEFNMWSKKTNPSFEEKMDWFIKNGWISNINKGGIREGAGDINKAAIPSAIKIKLEKALDVLDAKKLTYPQKLQVLGKVLDSMNIDRSELTKVTQKLKSKLESVNEGIIQDREQQLKNLKQGGEVNGGGYGPFKKTGRDTFVSPKGKLYNSSGLIKLIGTFSDFKVK